MAAGPEQNKNAVPLLGRVALISGGLGDIGRSIAAVLLQQGATVASCDLVNPAEAKNRMGHTDRLRYAQVDVSDAEAVQHWVRQVASTVGSPSIVIVNAGITDPRPLLQSDAKQWRQLLAVNLDGAMHVAQAGAAAMVSGGQGGDIIFVGSIAGHLPNANLTAYCVSKAGVRMLVRCLALELAPHGIRVNEIAPGNVNAGLSAKVFRADPSLRDDCLRHTPLNRLIEVEEISQWVLTLCLPQSRAMTGETIVLDAGYSLSRMDSL